jgi:hypothetical protein
MSEPRTLGKYSVGIGERFPFESTAKLRACVLAAEAGVDVIPVWNTSNREHQIVGSTPSDTRTAADSAVAELGWDKPYFVDADHIDLRVVNGFMDSADFFTIDVTDVIGRPAAEESIACFRDHHPELIGSISVPGLEAPLETSAGEVSEIARLYLRAAEAAGQVHRHIEQTKGPGTFITEVSMDEAASRQLPLELLVVLAALADQKVPVQTIAPKFSGDFYKGIDYIGDLDQFGKEFRADLAVIDFATARYGLPDELKISVHSGSDKFSIYPIIQKCLVEFDTGVHLKTAGTTWLEQLAGLASAGGEALALAKEIYAQAYDRRDELIAPYASVVDINSDRLPVPTDVTDWSEREFAFALRHDQTCSAYNPDFRQLLHIGYKIAAEMGDRFLTVLASQKAWYEDQITENIYERHLKPLFIGG